jgi:porphobilinogen synthase
MFVAHGIDRREPIAEMPGVDHLSIAHAVEEAGEAAALGIPAVLLFGLPAAKDDEGSGAWDDEGIVQLATRAIKEAHPDLLVICDLCLCEYTSHGHCGVLREGPHGPGVDNDATLELLSRTALSQARAGADIIAPSDMMDGRVGSIRSALDDDGFTETPIMAYSVKFASAFYGPFRVAADSAPAFGDRRCYQMDRAHRDGAVREACVLVLDPRVRPRSYVFDDASEQRRAIEPGAYDLVRALVRVRDPARQLARVHRRIADEREDRRWLVTGLYRQTFEVYGPYV